MRKYRNVTTIKENGRLYGIWGNMKKRCYEEKCDRYKDYGGRGITICEEWLNDFDIFADWAHANGYECGLTIDRTDNDGNYEPSNCRWITKREQNLNKRQNRQITYKGKTKPLKVWCDELNLPYDATHNRIVSGWDVERAFTEPMAYMSKSWSQKCREHGINPGTARDRILKFGWTEEDALKTPVLARGACHNKYSDRNITATCPVCGIEFHKVTVKKKYCSEKCHVESKHAWYRRKMSSISA